MSYQLNVECSFAVALVWLFWNFQQKNQRLIQEMNFNSLQNFAGMFSLQTWFLKKTNFVMNNVKVASIDYDQCVTHAMHIAMGSRSTGVYLWLTHLLLDIFKRALCAHHQTKLGCASDGASDGASQILSLVPHAWSIANWKETTII